jgi:FMN phosphatase YigB (HAD superfamily)
MGISGCNFSVFTKKIHRVIMQPPPLINRVNYSNIIKSKLAIIDLDKTLWNFNSGFQNMDINPLYENNRKSLHLLKKSHYLTIASLSPDPIYALKCIDTLFDKSFFDQIVIFGLYNKTFCKNNDIMYNPNENTLTKQMHFETIQKQSSIPYTSMILFDDDDSNIGLGQLLGMNTKKCINYNYVLNITGEI